MRKLMILFFICLFAALTSTSQDTSRVYATAKYLAQKYSKITKRIALDAGAKSALRQVMSADSVTSAVLNRQPFFEDLFEEAPAAGVDKFKPPVGGLAGLNVTKYVNAIADIMIERAKQELTVAFFNRFKKFAEENPEFEILFPKTASNLKNLFAYTYPQMLPALRNGFFEDLKQITYHLDDVLELPRYQLLLEKLPTVRVAIRSIRLIHELESGTSTIADVLLKLSQLNEWTENGKPAFHNMGYTVKLAAIFSEALRSDDSTRIWVSAKDIKTMLKDSLTTRLFFGLIYQQIKTTGIKFEIDVDGTLVTKNLAEIIKNTRTRWFLFENKISEFVNLGDKVTAVYKEVKAKIDSSLVLESKDVFSYIDLSIDVADYAFSIVKVFEQKLTADEYLAIARKSNSLFRNIYREEYTQAVNDAIDILSSVYDLTKSERPNMRNDLEKLLEQLNKFVQNVKPYALFMANVIEAEDEADVKAALENVILPVGSSSIKKNTEGLWGNISVQTYLGAYASLTDNNSVNEGAWSDKFGVIAPIGISWTPGFLSWKRAGSLSVFASLFDLGAIVDYKLKKDSIPNSSGTGTEVVVDKDYEVKFGQIFSPGGYLVYGFFGNLPLSLGVGAQYGPGLSKIEAGNNAVLTNPSWRWNVFLAVDMPFFTLKNKVKSK